MLGNIARKLRLLGYDLLYFSDIDDKKLIDIAKKEKRIIISKDLDVINKTHNLRIKSIYITKEEEIEQFSEIIREIDLKTFYINGNIARCSKCNSLTKSTDKNNIKEKIPQSF